MSTLLSTESLRVLVVDDEPGMRSGVSRALGDFRVEVPELQTELCFRVDEGSTGEDALTQIETFPPDIILLDCKLPGISGMEMLKHLDGDDRDLVVIMITAYASLEMAIRATKRGAYDLLAKPFTPDELKAAVGKAAKHLILQRSARALEEERRQVRFRFLSVLAHELKAPLAAVSSYLSVLKEWPVAERPDEYDCITGRCLLRMEGMHKLIMDLFDLTRIESGQKKRRIEAIDLERVARESLDAFRAEAEERDITVALHTEGLLTFEADRSEIEMILNNLVSNAVKYNRDGGKVDLRVVSSDEDVRIEVTDTGIGMTPEEVSRLFEEFVRIKNAKTEKIVGSGLGLSIVRKIVNLYKGEISVDSRPSAGSIFRIRLPKVAPKTGRFLDCET